MPPLPTISDELLSAVEVDNVDFELGDPVVLVGAMFDPSDVDVGAFKLWILLLAISIIEGRMVAVGGGSAADAALPNESAAAKEVKA